MSKEIHQKLHELTAEISSLKDIIKELLPPKSSVVTTSEAAKILGISTSTMLRLYKKGKTPKNVSKGKHLRFERIAIEKMAKAKTTGRPRKAA